MVGLLNNDSYSSMVFTSSKATRERKHCGEKNCRPMFPPSPHSLVEPESRVDNFFFFELLGFFFVFLFCGRLASHKGALKPPTGVEDAAVDKTQKREIIYNTINFLEHSGGIRANLVCFRTFLFLQI